MNSILRELPPYEKVLYISKGDTLVLHIQNGQAVVKIHHTLRVCNLVIFFGIVAEEFVHGYFDYDGKTGAIATDE